MVDFGLQFGRLQFLMYFAHKFVSCYLMFLSPHNLFLFLCLQHHGSSRFASTSVVKQSSGGLFGWLLGGKPTQLPTLDVPLPGITLPPALPDFVEPAKTKVTTLPNGIKIASETSMVLLSACRCFTVFPFFVTFAWK
jgi:hypothetical protein